MAALTNSFAGGSDGTTITTANSGGGSGNAFNLIDLDSQTAEFDTGRAAHGFTSGRFVTGGSSGSPYVSWTSGVSANTVYIRAYLYLSAAPASNTNILRVLTGANTIIATIRVNSTGKLAFLYSSGTLGGTSSANVTTGGWFRVEARIVSSTTNGSVEVRLYNDPDSTTITETLSVSGVNTGSDTAISRYRAGILSSVTNTEVGIDDLGFGDADWFGPAGSSLEIDPASPALVTGTSSTATTASFTAPADSLLVALCSSNSGTVTHTVTNSGTALTWTSRVKRGIPETGASSATVEIFTAPAASSASRTVTLTSSNGGDFVALKVLVIAGADLSSPVGQTGEASSTTANITPTVYTSSVAGSRAVGVAADGNQAGNPTTSDVGFAWDQFIQSSGIAVYKAANTASSSSSVTLNFNGTGGSRAWNWAAIEVKPVAGTNATATPSVVAATASIPAPTVSAQANATATPSVVAAAASIPEPGVSTGTAAVLRAVSEAGDRAATVTGDKPAGTATGDLLMAVHGCDTGTLDDMTTPTGGATWTLLGSYQSGDGDQHQVKAWWKIAGGSEPASWDFAQASGADGVVIIAAIENPSADTPVIAGTATDSSASIATPGVTPISATDLELRFATGVPANAARAWTAPGELTEQADVQSTTYTTGTLATRTLSSSSATGTLAFTASGTLEFAHGFTIAVAGGSASDPDATATPGVVSAPAAVPAPTLSTGSTASSAVVAATGTVPAPTLSTSATASPTVVAATTVVPAPDLSTGSAASPATVQAAASVPAPTLSTSSATTPATVAAVAAVPTPTVTAVTAASPTTVTATATIPAPSVSTSSTAAPDVAEATATVPTPGASAGATASPGVASATSTIPAPALSAGATASPAVAAAVAAVPAPTISAGSTTQPATVQASASIPEPTVTTGQAIQPDTVTATASIPALAVATDQTVTPAAVTAVTTIPAPAVQTGSASTATPDTVQAAASIPSPAIAAGSTAAPPVVAASSTVDAPTVSAGATASPGVVETSTTIPGTSTATGATATPSAVQAAATVPAPTVEADSGATPTPTVVATAASVPSPTVSTGSTAAPTLVLATAAVPTPTTTVLVAATPAAVQAFATVPAALISTTARPPTVAAVASIPAPTTSTGEPPPDLSHLGGSLVSVTSLSGSRITTADLGGSQI